MPSAIPRFQQAALPRVVFVTGKGGTGKSTVAAALAAALARRRPTTLADLDGRRSSMRLLGIEAVAASAAPAVPASGANGDRGALEAVAITAQDELQAFIDRIVPVRAISRRMLRSRTFNYVTAALPGLEAFLLLERMRHQAGHAALGDGFVVVDAPATGHALELLAVAKGLRQLAPAGTLNRLSSAVEEFLIDPNRFGVIITLTPEEMALSEALEAAAALRERLGVACIGAVLNCVPPALFTAAEVARAGARGDHAALAERRHAAVVFAREARRRLERTGLAVAELPMLYVAALGTDAAATLADRLEGTIG